MFAARIFRTVPLDQLFELGLDRDSTLVAAWPRRDDRRKERGALLWPSLRIDQFGTTKRSFMTADFFRLRGGPFLDTGRITDDSGRVWRRTVAG